MADKPKFDAKAYRYEYERKKLKRIPLDLQTREYDRIKARSTELGIGAATYIKELIWQDINHPSLRLRDLVPDEVYTEFMRVATEQNADFKGIFTRALTSWTENHKDIKKTQ